jgi:hypothetical protein
MHARAFLLVMFIALAGCGDESSAQCWDVMGREIDPERVCTLGTVHLGCFESEKPYALTGFECRIDGDGRVFLGVTLPSSETFEDLENCPSGSPYLANGLGYASTPCSD